MTTTALLSAIDQHTDTVTYAYVPTTIDNLARLLSEVVGVWERNTDNQDSNDAKLFDHMADLLSRVYDWQDLSVHAVEGDCMIPGSFE